jgi:IS4 transposase
VNLVPGHQQQGHEARGAQDQRAASHRGQLDEVGRRAGELAGRAAVPRARVAKAVRQLEEGEQRNSAHWRHPVPVRVSKIK